MIPEPAAGEGRMLSRWLARTFALAVWALALLSIGSLAVLGVARMLNPLEFGVGDGLMLDHIVRVAHGQPLYVEPSLEFIPLAYMPLYVYVVAPLVWLLGPGFWSGRLVSLAASLALAFLMLRVIRRETGRWTLGVAGAGLYLMGQGLTHGSYDSIRPDPLMLFLAFSGLAVLRFSRGAAGAVGAAALLTAAFFTKQHALCFAAAALLHLACCDRRRLPAFAIALVVGCGGGYLLASLAFGPWFSFYVYDVPSHWSHFSRARVLGYVGTELFGRLGLLSIPVLLSLMLPERPWRGDPGLWWWVGLGGVGSGLLATLDPYTFAHVFMPTMAAFALLGPLALHRLSERLTSPGGGNHAGMTVACAALVLQFVSLRYPPQMMLPPRGAREARAALELRLRAIPGPVIVPTHGFYGWSAGKGTSLHTLPLDDILRARGNRLLARDPEFFDRFFERLRRGPGRPVIVSDTTLARCGAASAPLWASLEGSYRLSGRLGDLTRTLRPVAGYRGAPNYIYEPVEPVGAEGAGGQPAPSRAASPGATPAGSRR